MLRRHEREDDVERRDSKRVRFTHKQTDKRADLELTNDTAAKRAKLFDTSSSSSSSSSSHEVAPNLHDSFGGVGDPETRERAMKKSRVDADKDICAIEALTNAKLEVDRALDKANKTLRRMLEEIPLESQAVTPKPQNLTASETSESTLKFTRGKPTPRLSAARGC